MKLAKKSVRHIRKSDIIIGFLLILIIVLLIGKLFLVKNCKYDSACFDEMAKICYPTKMYKVSEDNLYRYQIDGRSGKNCVITVTNVQMAIGTPVDIAKKFEGKSMECSIPMNNLGKFSEITKMTDYCSGPLKEAIYELIIERMYGLIIQNLGEVVDDIKDLQGMP